MDCAEHHGQGKGDVIQETLQCSTEAKLCDADLEPLEPTWFVPSFSARDITSTVPEAAIAQEVHARVQELSVQHGVVRERLAELQKRIDTVATDVVQERLTREACISQAMAKMECVCQIMKKQSTAKKDLMADSLKDHGSPPKGRADGIWQQCEDSIPSQFHVAQHHEAAIRTVSGNITKISEAMTKLGKELSQRISQVEAESAKQCERISQLDDGRYTDKHRLDNLDARRTKDMKRLDDLSARCSSDEYNITELSVELRTHDSELRSQARDINEFRKQYLSRYEELHTQQVELSNAIQTAVNKVGASDSSVFNAMLDHLSTLAERLRVTGEFRTASDMADLLEPTAQDRARFHPQEANIADMAGYKLRPTDPLSCAVDMPIPDAPLQQKTANGIIMNLGRQDSARATGESRVDRFQSFLVGKPEAQESITASETPRRWKTNNGERNLGNDFTLDEKSASRVQKLSVGTKDAVQNGLKGSHHDLQLDSASQSKSQISTQGGPHKQEQDRRSASVRTALDIAASEAQFNISDLPANDAIPAPFYESRFNVPELLPGPDGQYFIEHLTSSAYTCADSSGPATWRSSAPETLLNGSAQTLSTGSDTLAVPSRAPSYAGASPIQHPIFGQALPGGGGIGCNTTAASCGVAYDGRCASGIGAETRWYSAPLSMRAITMTCPHRLQHESRNGAPPPPAAQLGRVARSSSAGLLPGDTRSSSGSPAWSRETSLAAPCSCHRFSSPVTARASRGGINTAPTPHIAGSPWRMTAEPTTPHQSPARRQVMNHCAGHLDCAAAGLATCGPVMSRGMSQPLLGIRQHPAGICVHSQPAQPQQPRPVHHSPTRQLSTGLAHTPPRSSRNALQPLSPLQQSPSRAHL